MKELNYLSNAEPAYLESMYVEYQNNPSSLDESWRRFFEGFEFGSKSYTPSNNKTKANPEQLSKEIKVLELINGYRSRGHLFATINPIFPPKNITPNLDLDNFGLTNADLEESFFAGNEVGLGTAKLKDILSLLKTTYCGNIGVEYRYIRNPEVLKWFQKKMEGTKNTPSFSKEGKLGVLRKMVQANFFENFLAKKFVGQKRFSLEGGESLIPSLDATIEKGAELGIEEFIIGMAHRGRLNVLTNIMQKPYLSVFGEFQDKGIADDVFDGDVKYHMGQSSDAILNNGNKIHLSLAPNPSHLEAVDPVVLGMARAKIDRNHNGNMKKVCPIIIHGDASLSGQGLVYELMQMSLLDGYKIGGTVHIVVNNQVGFTTDPKDSRSSTYCTDVAKVTLSPVFHVNGDDPEAVAFMTMLAMEYRQEFHKDVFIDIICYRKFGHNEGDEPRYTQPLMYAAIDKHVNPYKLYSQKLLDEKSVTAEEIAAVEKKIDDLLTSDFDKAKEMTDFVVDPTPKRAWDGIKVYDDNNVEPNPNTTVQLEVLKTVSDKLSTIPSTFNPHKNIVKLYGDRKKMVWETEKIDWGMGEMLAYGTLINEGFDVRISGQDVKRGTFTHRHAVIWDQTNNEEHAAINSISEKQGTFYIYNSLLSEYGVLGYEYGYASSSPNTLTIWEAQFGDFVNGAQIIIDQFLSAAKSKWRRLNGMVMLLPHGYEGQGPEHSSCRYERLLNLCAQNNMYICNFTTPANMFHGLRRQLHSDSRKPLVIITPKSLLRHPSCQSTLKDFTEGSFQEVYDDPTADAKKVKRVLFCSGKIYYDLEKYKNHFQIEDTAIVRIEQLYPMPLEQVNKIVKKYKAKEHIWVQEEPENMGAWSYILRKLRGVNLDVVSRKEAASPATGSPKQHARQQNYIIKKALNIAKETELPKI